MANKRPDTTGREPQLPNRDLFPSTGAEPLLGGDRSFDAGIWRRLVDRGTGKEGAIAGLSPIQGRIYTEALLSALPGKISVVERVAGGDSFSQQFNASQRVNALQSLGLLGSRFGGHLASDIAERIAVYLQASEDPLVRVEAIAAIGLCQDSSAEKTLLKEFDDRDWRIRRAAIHAVGEIGTQRAFQRLIQVIEAPESSNDLVMALEALGLLGQRLGGELANQVYDRLMSILMRGADSLQRGGAARALGFLGDERALDILIELAMQSRGDIQAAAIQSLGMFGSAEGVPPLIFALTNSGFTVRQDVIDALTRIGLDSVQPLMAVLRHPDPSIRSGAIEVLGKVKAIQSLDLLVRLVRDPVPEVRKAAVVALGLIADHSTIEPMLVALSDSDPSVRKEAAMMLAVFRDERAVGPLCLALWDLDLRVRWFAAYSLGVMGDVRAVQPLLQILKDPSEHVVNAASDALCRIGSIALPAIIEFESQNPDLNKITASVLSRLQDYD